MGQCMSKTLLIDANSIGRAANHATKLSANGIETQAIFGFLKTMKVVCQRYRAYTPMVLWDGRAEWRYKLYPDYKGTRNSDPKKVADKEAYEAQVPYIRRALSHLGVRQMTARFHEADDLAGYFVGRLKTNPEARIGLISGDQDWIQLVNPQVWWRDMRDDAKQVSHKNFFDYTGCKSPFAFLESKVLQGDSSDNISGVGGIGEKGAPEFIAEFGSVRNFWKQVESGAFEPKKKAHINLATGPGRELYKRNLQLMQLMRVTPPKKEDITLDKGLFDRDAFAGICEELAFVSILKNMDEFTSYFTEQ